VSNLANGFQWLPDGKILLAAIMRGDRDEAVRQQGRALLIEASYQYPMFTDALSLMVDLLRRWPGQSDRERDECDERVRAFSTVSTGADLDATCLTVTISRDLVS
jgi:hypothetical protein